MIKKVLIANRGEIAVRIHRACKEVGIKTVAIHSTADTNAMHVRIADESVCVGGPYAKDSYINMHNIIAAATITDANAIHPGYGFLSENVQFAKMVENHGFIFIGPKSDHIKLMGDKITAKKTAESLGIPTVPGSEGAISSIDEALKVAEDLGYPVIIKSSSGGGGKGMKLAENKEDILKNFELSRSEAKASFGDDTVYIEKFLTNPKHIEIQILGDKHGNVIHLGERDCSVQRQNQKVIEETPSASLTQYDKDYIFQVSLNAMKKFGYHSAGTLEYLYENGKFYFMEMNTRLQVEHTVTEMVTGVDIVKAMIRIADDQELGITQNQVQFKGHAIECRINAEDPETFRPSPGKIVNYHSPGGFGVRVDSFLYTGYSIPPYYDSMISKVICHSDNRDDCIEKMIRTLNETIIDGPKTTIPLLQDILQAKEFKLHTHSVKWLEKWLDDKSQD